MDEVTNSLGPMSPIKHFNSFQDIDFQAIMNIGQRFMLKGGWPPLSSQADFIHSSSSEGGSLGEGPRVSSADLSAEAIAEVEAFSDRHNFSDGDSEGGAGGANRQMIAI